MSKSQLAFTCSKLIETLEQEKKYLHISHLVLVFLLVTMSMQVLAYHQQCLPEILQIGMFNGVYLGIFNEVCWGMFNEVCCGMFNEAIIQETKFLPSL